MNDRECWAAVVARDARFDGRFVTAVKTTGIYCRPSCTARRPLRANVSFYASPDAAERAGFRACLRCKPRDPKRDESADKVRRACAFIDAHDDGRPSLDAIAKHVGSSPFHLQRLFRATLGVTPRQYADAKRVQRLKGELRNGHAVTSALYTAGYGSSSRLYERAHAQLGMTPATYGRGGKGAQIRFATSRSPLGRLLVAATERGVCAVMLGNDDATLARQLRCEYPAAIVSRDRVALDCWVRSIVEHLEGRMHALDLPIDVRATAFQRRVWEALRAIPYGQTRSYSEVAREIGRPKATRAVARACATNPVAIVVPCHRVIRSTGALGGYAGGVERKRAILARERRASAREAKSC
ncbi:MAG: bifunctional DNA-binding transcriptional regulator/O6-methylguanine-DNA methyltransferase Ada [Planctomycetes bacterium]|nr:bifunctional DNA-binding transcriptional regulator/O6-methylguanine-DNA methyltransferase Ada [Planctomycetota bacterium]